MPKKLGKILMKTYLPVISAKVNSFWMLTRLTIVAVLQYIKISFHCTPETSMLYVNYTSIKK